MSRLKWARELRTRYLEREREKSRGLIGEAEKSENKGKIREQMPIIIIDFIVFIR